MTKTKQNKKLIIFILALLISSIIVSSIAHADVLDNLANRVSTVFDNYQSGSDSPQRKLIDGILFFTLFLSIALLGLRKWYGKPSPAVNGIAISLAALMTLALLSYTDITLALLFPFAKNILFFIMLLVVYSIISSRDIIKSKMLALIFALLLTFAMFHAEGLIEEYKAGESYNFFKLSSDILSPAGKVGNCNDGIRNAQIKNGNVWWEVGVDCGGPCPPCVAAPPTEQLPLPKPTPVPTPTPTECKCVPIYYDVTLTNQWHSDKLCTGEEKECSGCEGKECANKCWPGIGAENEVGGFKIIEQRKAIAKIIGKTETEEACKKLGQPTTITGNSCAGQFGNNVDCRTITDCPTTKPNNQYTGTYPAASGTTYYYIPGKCSANYSTGYCCYSEKTPGIPPWTAPARAGGEGPVSGSGVQTITQIIGKNPQLNDYNAIFDYVQSANGIFWKDAGITKQTSKATWDKIANDATKGPKLIQGTRLYKESLDRRSRW